MGLGTSVGEGFSPFEAWNNEQILEGIQDLAMAYGDYVMAFLNN